MIVSVQINLTKYCYKTVKTFIDLAIVAYYIFFFLFFPFYQMNIVRFTISCDFFNTTKLNFWFNTLNVSFTCIVQLIPFSCSSNGIFVDETQGFIINIHLELKNLKIVDELTYDWHFCPVETFVCKL